MSVAFLRGDGHVIDARDARRAGRVLDVGGGDA